MLAGSGYQLLESLDWTIVEVTLGPDSQRLVHGPCELKCCERTLDVLPTDGLWNDKCVCLICV